MRVALTIALFLSLNAGAAEKKVKKSLSPYQQAIKKCFEDQVDVGGVVDNKKLYLEIVKAFPLQASETTFREVLYAVGGENRKLRLEDGVVQIFKIDADEKVQLLSSDDVNRFSNSNGMRYKLKGIEAKIAERLIRAEIKSDFVKTSEYRAKQLTLNLVWLNGQIKNLTALISGEKLKLECQKLDLADICECKP